MLVLRGGESCAKGTPMMTVPGATAEASLYRSTGAYGGWWARAAASGGRRLTPQQGGIGPLVPGLPIEFGPIVVRPCRPPWQCRLEYLLCQGQISRCVDRCLSDNLFQCASAPDPQACEAGVRQRCLIGCQVACDGAYQNCLQCR
jgi:hypothetical protein